MSRSGDVNSKPVSYRMILSNCWQADLEEFNTHGNSSAPLISDAEDGLRVRDNDQIDRSLSLVVRALVLRQIGLSVQRVEMGLQLRLHAVSIGERDVASSRSSEKSRVIGDSLMTKQIRCLIRSKIIHWRPKGQRKQVRAVFSTYLSGTRGVKDTEKLLEVI